MTAAIADERWLFPGPIWAPPAAPTFFPIADRGPVVLADDPCEAGFSGVAPEYAGIYLHARYFDPKLGTFLSPDPIGVDGGSNLYGYGFGDPINNADASGLSPNGGPDIPWWGWWALRKLWGLISGGSGQPGCNPFTNPCNGAAAEQRHARPHDTEMPSPTAYVPGKHIDPYSDCEEPGPDSLVWLIPGSGGPVAGPVAGGEGDDGKGSDGNTGGGRPAPGVVFITNTFQFASDWARSSGTPWGEDPSLDAQQVRDTLDNLEWVANDFMPLIASVTAGGGGTRAFTITCRNALIWRFSSLIAGSTSTSSRAGFRCGCTRFFTPQGHEVVAGTKPGRSSS